MKGLSLLALILVSQCACARDTYISLDDGARLRIASAGQGQPLVFIPGWTMTRRFFEKQEAHFSSTHHVVTYDPRGQGRSDKTVAGNTYADHANDLRQILLQRDLSEVVVVGWSSGCLTMYEYIRRFGFDRIQKLVFIDEPPKWIGDTSSEWVYGNFDDYRRTLKDMVSRPADPDGIINWMLKRPVSGDARAWMNDEMKMTPPHIALNLFIDALAADYTPEVARIEVPALFMIRSELATKAETWLKQRRPAIEVAAISSHAMFWEEPEKFNETLSRFLTR